MVLSERLAMLFHELEGYRLSYIRMSKDMGKASSYVGSLLNGQNKSPSEDFYDYLQMRFNANPEWLRTGEGEMFLAGGKVNHYSAASYTQMLYSLPEDERILVQNMLTILMRDHQKSGNANEK